MRKWIVPLIFAATAWTAIWLLVRPTPSVEEVTIGAPIRQLPSCVRLQNWQHEGQETWWSAIKDGDTYTICGSGPFHTGPADSATCILPLVSEAVMVEGQTEDYPHHRVVGEFCLDEMYGGIQGRCKRWNCEDITAKALYPPGCTIIKSRVKNTCESMWGL